MQHELQRILYVEDEPDIQAVACVALQAVGGFTVEVCSSGKEALNRAVSFAPDLFLLDVMMPGMDGVSTLQTLRTMPAVASIPAIFMTAKVQPQEIAQLMALGALDVIPKPFDPMTLAEQIRQIWRKS